MRAILPFLLLVIGFQISLNAQLISDWRGIGRIGVYNESGLLSVWPAEGPKMLWSIPNLPKGNSSVSTGESLLYTTGIKGDEEILVALDYSGGIKWQVPFGKAWEGSFPESRVTPAVEKDRVYVSTGSGEVSGINAVDGKVIWKTNVKEKYEGVCGNWGFAESVLVVDNKVIYTPGGNKTTLVALDKNTGETIWASETLSDAAVFVSPILIEYNGMRQIVSVTKSYILGVSPNDGKIIWKFEFGKYVGNINRNNNCTTPLYFNGNIYVTSGYNHSGVMLKLLPDCSGVSLVWKDDVLDNHHGGVVKVGNYIYGSNWLNNGMGNWVCLNWETGAVMYEQEWINKGSIIAADGLLYCYEEKTGNIALVKAIPEKFEIISTFKVPLGTGPHWAHPVIYKGVLYIRHGDAIMAYNIKNE
jgi:outer membrane protein assembly factor BamB